MDVDQSTSGTNGFQPFVTLVNGPRRDQLKKKLETENLFGLYLFWTVLLKRQCHACFTHIFCCKQCTSSQRLRGNKSLYTVQCTRRFNPNCSKFGTFRSYRMKTIKNIFILYDHSLDSLTILFLVKSFVYKSFHNHAIDTYSYRYLLQVRDTQCTQYVYTVLALK